jgi:hypothetical protein
LVGGRAGPGDFLFGVYHAKGVPEQQDAERAETGRCTVRGRVAVVVDFRPLVVIGPDLGGFIIIP